MGKRELTDLRRPRPGERSTTVGLRDGVHLGLAAIFDDQQTDTVTGRVQVTNRKERWNRCRLHAEQALRNVCHAAERPAESGSAFQARAGETGNWMPHMAGTVPYVWIRTSMSSGPICTRLGEASMLSTSAAI